MSRDYCFTAWREPEVGNFTTVKYMIYGKEICPNTGKIHYQGYVIFNRTARFPKAKEWIGAGDETHIEIRNGSRDQAREYCMKDNDYQEIGIYNKLELKNILLLDINVIKENYPDIFCRYYRGLEKMLPKGEKWRDICVTWLWGRSGSGKTKKVMEMDDVYKLDRPMKWFDGYEKNKILLLDDVDIDDFYKNRGLLLNVLDGYQLRVASKGSHLYAHWTEVFITSNWDPCQLLQEDEAFNRRVHVVTELG